MMEVHINHRELESREEIPYIHRLSYANSLKYCATIAANAAAKAARIAAKALLSTMDGERYPFDASELDQADQTTLEAIITLFRLRALGTPPQRLIVNGEAVYDYIAKRWEL